MKNSKFGSTSHRVIKYHKDKLSEKTLDSLYNILLTNTQAFACRELGISLGTAQKYAKQWGLDKKSIY